ncbi:MAG: serine protease [Planctomycetaceae bacterium]|jgi:S1-C subfamily serine protease|nr:serine protease [Planctomycetaceae bacterium]
MELLTHFQNLFHQIKQSDIPLLGLQERLRQIIILTIVTIILPVSIAMAEDFGIPKRNPTFTQSSYSASSISSGLPSFSIAAQPSKKIGSQVSGLPISGSPSSNAQVSNVQVSNSQISGSRVAALSESQNTPSLSQFPNVVRLVAFDQSGQSFGSGSYIGNYGEYGLILSNWHVIYGADGLVHIHFPNGFSSYGAVILSDQKWDLALIVISRPPRSVPFLPISQTTPKPGDPLWIAGYGSGSYRLAGGHCVRYLAPEIPRDGSAPQYEIVDLSVSARQGDSGGPILNSKGELAGVLFGSDMVRSTAGSYCERVNRFLNQTRSSMESLPSRPEVYFASIEQGGPRHLLSESISPAISTEHVAVSASQQRRTDLAGSSLSFGTHSGSRRYTQPVPPSSFSVFEKKVDEIQTSQPKPTGLENPENSSSVPEIPLAPLSFESNPVTFHKVQTAAWTEINLSTEFRYGSFGVRAKSSVDSSDKTPIIQVGHQSLETSEKQPPEESLKEEKQQTQECVANISSEKHDSANHSLTQPIPASVADKITPTEENNKKIVETQGLTSVSERHGSFPPMVLFCCCFIVSVLVVFSFRLLKNDQIQPL